MADGGAGAGIDDQDLAPPADAPLPAPAATRQTAPVLNALSLVPTRLLAVDALADTVDSIRAPPPTGPLLLASAGESQAQTENVDALSAISLQLVASLHRRSIIVSETTYVDGYNVLVSNAPFCRFNTNI